MKQYQIIITIWETNAPIVKSELIPEHKVYDEFYNFIHDLSIKINKELHVKTNYLNIGINFDCVFEYNNRTYWVQCYPIMGINLSDLTDAFVSSVNRLNEDIINEKKIIDEINSKYI